MDNNIWEYLQSKGNTKEYLTEEGFSILVMNYGLYGSELLDGIPEDLRNAIISAYREAVALEDDVTELTIDITLAKWYPFKKKYFAAH